MAAALASAGSLLLLLGSVQAYRRQRALHTLTLALGAAALFVAGTLAAVIRGARAPRGSPGH